MSICIDVEVKLLEKNKAAEFFSAKGQTGKILSLKARQNRSPRIYACERRSKPVA